MEIYCKNVQQVIDVDYPEVTFKPQLCWTRQNPVDYYHDAHQAKMSSTFMSIEDTSLS